MTSFHLTLLFQNVGKKWKRLTKYQKEVLKSRFQAKPYLDKGERPHFAKLLNIGEPTVQMWFATKRCIRKRKGIKFNGE